MNIQELKHFLRRSLANADDFSHTNESAKKEIDASIHELHTIANSCIDLESAFVAIEAFLENRWDRIQNTNLAYPCCPNSRMTILCVKLAMHISIDGFYHKLMPTIRKTQDIDGIMCDELSLNQFVLSDDNHRYFRIDKVLDSAINDGILKDVVDGQEIKLTPTEVERVIKHSPQAADLYNAYKKRALFKTEMSIGSEVFNATKSIEDFDKECSEAKSEFDTVMANLDLNFKETKSYPDTSFDRVLIKMLSNIDMIIAFLKNHPGPMSTSFFNAGLFTKMEAQLVSAINDILQSYDPVNDTHPVARILGALPLPGRMELLRVVSLDSITHCDDLRHVIALQHSDNTVEVINLFDKNPQKLSQLVTNKNDLIKLLEVMNCKGDTEIHNTDNLKKIIKFIDKSFKNKLSTQMYKELMLIITKLYSETCRQSFFSSRTKEAKIGGAQAILSAAKMGIFKRESVHSKGTLKMLVERMELSV